MGLYSSNGFSPPSLSLSLPPSVSPSLSLSISFSISLSLLRSTHLIVMEIISSARTETKEEAFAYTWAKMNRTVV